MRLQQKDSIQTLRDNFVWEIPEMFNIGTDVSDRIAIDRADQIAIIDVGEDASFVEYTFDQLKSMSNRAANMLSELCERGERIGVLLPQSIETAVAHVAIMKMGGITLPLFTLFGPDALFHRVENSGAKLVITNKAGAQLLSSISDKLPMLKHVICVDKLESGEASFAELCAMQSDQFEAVKTKADDPAILIYTSGTTGNPKGALHGHRVLFGHLPGVEMSHDFFPQPDDIIWTPADWAWIGGLLDVLLPALHHGVPVVAQRFKKFSPEAAFSLIRDHKIRNAFLPPTAMKMMRLDPDAEGWKLDMRSVASGGETLGKELIEWGQRVLGTTINEFYGQTECNMIISSCAAMEPAEPGVMGFCVPGHHVEIIDEDTGMLQSIGQEGSIAVRYPDPVMFLEYWENPEATKAKFIEVAGDKWLLTGDKGIKTPTGRFSFLGREDDVISSAGYRIGPAEIEDCLLTHPAVHLAGVVGKPDLVRGAVVAAYIKLAEGVEGSKALADEIAQHVKVQLAAYEFPRVVNFVEEMPMTTTGKIIRAELRRLAEEEATNEN